MVCLPSTVLNKFFFGSGNFTVLCHTDMRSHHLPHKLPLGAYRSASHTFHTVTLNHMPSKSYICNIPHPRQVEVRGLGVFRWFTNVLFCSLVT